MPGRAELAAGTLLGLLLAGPAAAVEPAPDAGFLEFLGLLVEDDGEYLDPLDMASVRLPEDDGSEQEWPDGAHDERTAGDGALPEGVPAPEAAGAREGVGAEARRALENDHEHEH